MKGLGAHVDNVGPTYQASKQASVIRQQNKLKIKKSMNENTLQQKKIKKVLKKQ